jgi:hypothetical protein
MTESRPEQKAQCTSRISGTSHCYYFPLSQTTLGLLTLMFENQLEPFEEPPSKAK